MPDSNQARIFLVGLLFATQQESSRYLVRPSRDPDHQEIPVPSVGLHTIQILCLADGINVGYSVYRIETKITEEGATIEAGLKVDRRDRRTRDKRWENWTRI